jgi:hypothetical protein
MSNEDKQQDTQAPVTPWNLAIYYRRIFPSHIYCKWLAYGERESNIVFFTAMYKNVFHIIERVLHKN